MPPLIFIKLRNHEDNVTVDSLRYPLSKIIRPHLENFGAKLFVTPTVWPLLELATVCENWARFFIWGCCLFTNRGQVESESDIVSSSRPHVVDLFLCSARLDNILVPR